MSTTPEEVLSYWFPEGFDEADPQTRRRQAQRWMAGGPKVDREITERFRDTLEQARRGELGHWAQTAREGDKIHAIVLEDVKGETIYLDYGGLAPDFDKVAPEAQKLVDSVKWGGS